MVSETINAAQAAPSPAPNLVSRFLQWWAAELKACLPSAKGEAKRKRLRALVLNFTETGAEVLVQDPSGKVRRRLLLEEPLEKQRKLRPLRRGYRGKRPKNRQVGLRLKAEDCFERSFPISAEALDDVRQIAAIELERKTPFKLADVYWDYHLAKQEPGKGKLMVRQFVVKRAALDELLERAGGLDLEPSFADVYDTDPADPVPINFLAKAPMERETKIGSQAVKFAALLCAVTVGAAVYLELKRGDEALAELRGQIEQTRAKAISLRKRLNASGDANKTVVALRQKKVSSTPLVQIWEEVTRVLPDSAWIQEMRVEPDKIEINGVAKSAAGLVPLLENSVLFRGAKFSSQILSDSKLNLENFNITFQLEGLNGLAAAEPKEDTGQ